MSDSRSEDATMKTKIFLALGLLLVLAGCYSGGYYGGGYYGGPYYSGYSRPGYYPGYYYRNPPSQEPFSPTYDYMYPFPVSPEYP